MTRRHVFLALPAIACACLLALPESSFAQFGFFRGRGGNAYGYGNYGNMYGPGTYGGYSNNGFYTQQPFQSNPGSVNMLSSGDYFSNYPTSQGTVPSNRARIHMMVPAGARVQFDNSPTQQTGQERNFVTPDLEPNNHYTYQVSVEWRDQNGKDQRQNRTIRLTPGQTTNVNFLTGTNTDGSQNQQPDQINQPNRNQQDQNPNLNNPNRQNQNQKQQPSNPPDNTIPR